MECPISPRVSKRSLMFIVDALASVQKRFRPPTVIPVAAIPTSALPDAALPHDATSPGHPTGVRHRTSYGLRPDAGPDNKKPGPPARFSVLDARVAETVRGYSLSSI